MIERTVGEEPVTSKTAVCSDGGVGKREQPLRLVMVAMSSTELNKALLKGLLIFILFNISPFISVFKLGALKGEEVKFYYYALTPSMHVKQNYMVGAGDSLKLEIVVLILFQNLRTYVH